MSFFAQLFGGGQQQQQQDGASLPQVQQQSVQQQQSAQVSDANNPKNLETANPSVPAQVTAGDPSQQPVKSPIEQMTELLQNSKKPAAADQQDKFFNLDTEKLNNLVGAMDFTSGIPQETMAKFQQGDVGAMMEIMQAMQRNAVSSTLQMSTRLVEQGTKHASEQLSKTLPTQIMQQNVTTQLLQDNPYATPFANMIVEGLSRTNPNMNATQLQAQAGDILNKFADSIVQHAKSKEAATQPQQSQQQNQPQDFMQLLGLTDSSRSLF